MDAEHGGEAGEHVEVEGRITVLTHGSSPIVKGRAGWKPENRATLALIETPEIGDGEKRSQSRTADATPDVRGERVRVETVWTSR